MPGIARRTARGVPRYQADDAFLLSGDELVAAGPVPGGTRYRPRVESAFAQIVRLTDGWLVTGTDGVATWFGTPRPEDAPASWRDPAAVADPDDPSRVFAWLPTEIRDRLGNVIRYEYGADAGDTSAHRWHQPIPVTMRYMDHDAGGPDPAFLYTVGFEYEPRPDPFSSYLAGFEVRTTVRCRAVTTTAWPGGAGQPVRRYELRYRQDPHTLASLLAEVRVVGYAAGEDGATWTQQRDLPPVRFEYGAFHPGERRFLPVRCPEPPPVALSDGEYDLADVTGYGRPDVVRLGIAPTYWRNLGGGVLDRPRPLPVPLDGVSLKDRGVRLLDADGDGRVDLQMDSPVAGFLPLRSASQWGDFHPYRSAPVGVTSARTSAPGTGPAVRTAGTPWQDAGLRLVDLDGDGVTDAVLVGDRFTCWFQRPGTGWTGPVIARGVPPLDPGDPRVHWADLSGDGLQDLVLVESGAVRYWPNLGHGSFGAAVLMTGGPDLPVTMQPRRVLFGDVSGDGTADLVYAGAGEVTVWFNRSGNAWSTPLTVGGLPDGWWDARLRQRRHQPARPPLRRRQRGVPPTCRCSRWTRRRRARPSSSARPATPARAGPSGCSPALPSRADDRTRTARTLSSDGRAGDSDRHRLPGPGVEVVGDVGRGPADAANHGRRQGVLEQPAEDIDAGSGLDDPTAVHRLAGRVEDRQVDPAGVRPEPGGPDDAGHVKGAPVREQRLPVADAEGAGFALDDAGGEVSGLDPD